jgi:transforming growth factor-beta-induced protein
MSKRIGDAGRIHRLAFTPVLVATLALAGCGEDPTTPAPGTIVAVAANTPQLSTLVTALQAAGLTATLEGSGPFTVFAPVDGAFETLPQGTLDALVASGNEAILTDLLTYHVVPGALTADQLTNGQTLTTVEGGTLTVTVEGGEVRVGGMRVTTADVQASNGVIHLVDGVLLGGLNAVQRATVTPDLSTLVDLVGAAGLASTLASDGPFTIFAPVNSAFAALDPAQVERLVASENLPLLQKVLGYHVVPGRIRAADLTDGATVTTVEGSQLTIGLTGGPRVNGAGIIATDIEVSNGVVHLIDAVLTDHLDLVDVAVLNGFDALAEAVAAAGLVDALRGDNDGAGFTVFAPTDAAFAALGTVPSDPAALAQVLLYHVVPGTALSGSLSNGQTLTTLEGGTLTVSLGNGVTLQGAQNAARVIATDVRAANGVIHAIDAVLTP